MARPDPAFDGVLPVDKPAGPTSHDVVAMVRRALRTRRVGHTGTLDPSASGLLLVCVGSATRIAEYLTGLDKRYTATLRLGASTDTDDATGTVISAADPAGITRAALERALADMTGTILQRPPAYSAKRVAGERAHAAARAGRTLELEPVPVRIHEVRIVAFDPPDVTLDIACGSGTYIRAIARDIGAALGVGGHLVTLRRTRVGGHDVARAVAVADLADVERVAAARIAPLDALAHLPHIAVDTAQLAALRHGRTITVAHRTAGTVAVAAAGALVAVAECSGDTLRPRKVFA
jgi:tRNA pseudouridine55 synthase